LAGRDDEDYRWLVLKGQGTPYQLPYLQWLAKPVWFQVFNIIFISIYQHFLLLAIASLSLVVWNVAVHCGNGSDGMVVVTTMMPHQQQQQQQPPH
jgi:hypothetical protein